MTVANGATSTGRLQEVEESTPLLLTPEQQKHELLYQRFTPKQKRIIVALVSFCGLLPMFISGTFIPCIPQISEDLETTGPVVSMAVSVSIIGASLGSLIASSYSTFYGRRPIYLKFLPLLVLASVAVAAARTVAELMVWRVVQALGAAPAFSVGAGVIGDIYKLEERGEAMGVFFAAVLLGPALAPFVGGLTVHYTSWRTLQLLLGVMGCVLFVVLYKFLPETSHPGERGIDKLKAKEDSGPGSASSFRQYLPVFLNPLAPLGLMRYPNLLLVSLACLFILLTDYVLLIPISYTIGKRYDISNEMIIGACFLPAGLGNMLGAPLAGRLSDRIVARMRASRGGVWYPEDRLRATLVGALVLAPVSLWVSGWVTTYVENKPLGLSLNLLCLFVNGFGVDVVLSPAASYFVDVMHARSAEAMAANNAFRSLLMAGFVAGILPMIETYGLLVTDSISGASCLVSFVFLWIVIRYGDALRRWGGMGEVSPDKS